MSVGLNGLTGEGGITGGCGGACNPSLASPVCRFAFTAATPFPDRPRSPNFYKGTLHSKQLLSTLNECVFIKHIHGSLC